MELDALNSMVSHDLLKEAFRRIGHPFEAEFHSARRSLLSSNTGETDGELFRVKNFLEISNGKYPNLIRIETELRKLEIVVVTRKGEGLETLDDLDGRTVSYVPGHRIYKAMLGGREALNLIEIPDVNWAFQLLHKGRIDGVGSDRVLGEFRAARIEGFGDQISSIPIVDIGLYAFIHKRHKSLVPELEAAFEEMKRDGSFDRIRELAPTRYQVQFALKTAAVGN